MTEGENNNHLYIGNMVIHLYLATTQIFDEYGLRILVIAPVNILHKLIKIKY